MEGAGGPRARPSPEDIWPGVRGSRRSPFVPSLSRWTMGEGEICLRLSPSFRRIDELRCRVTCESHKDSALL